MELKPVNVRKGVADVLDHVASSPTVAAGGPSEHEAYTSLGRVGNRSGLQGFLPVLGAYLALRVALFFGNLLAADITNVHSWLIPFTAWDGHWYTQVAQHWYGATVLFSSHLTYAAGGFEPGWPALIKLGTLLGLSYRGSAYMMSLLVGGATVYAVWLLARELIPENPVMAVIAVLAFPGAAIAFGIAYSEVLSIGCVAATLYLLLRRRWLLVGVFAAVATATSSLAVVLCLVCLVEAFVEVRERKNYASILPVVIAPIGFVSYVAYLGYLAKDPFYWWKLQGQAWGAKIEPGYLFHWLHSPGGSGWGMRWLAALGLVILIYLVVTVVRSNLSRPAKVYCLAVAAMIIVNPALGPKPRFLFWMFPALLLLPRNLKPKALNAVLFLMAWLLPMLLIAYTTVGNTIGSP